MEEQQQQESNYDLDLVKLGLEGLIKYLKRNHKKILQYIINTNITDLIIKILQSNRIDILALLFNELNLNMEVKVKPPINECRRGYSTISLLDLATIYSSLETIKFIESLGVKNKIAWNYDMALELSPFSNDMNILQYFSAKVLKIGPKSINKLFVSANAILIGRIDMVEWISKNTPFLFRYDAIYFKKAMDFAAYHGNLEMVKWLHHNRTEGCTTYAITNAADKGHLEIIKWIHENRTEGCKANAMDAAARSGHLEIVKWLHENRTEGCTTEAITMAAECGQLEMVKWLHYNRTEGCTTRAMDLAAMEGELEVIKWLHENRTEGCTESALTNASHHPETIKWLKENIKVFKPVDFSYWLASDDDDEDDDEYFDYDDDEFLF